jgi:hypothetical protein
MDLILENTLINTLPVLMSIYGCVMVFCILMGRSYPNNGKFCLYIGVTCSVCIIILLAYILIHNILDPSH